MKTDLQAPRAVWTAPVLEQLTVDLDAISTSTASANDGGAAKANHRS